MARSNNLQEPLSQMENYKLNPLFICIDYPTSVVSKTMVDITAPLQHRKVVENSLKVPWMWSYLVGYLERGI